MHSMLLRAETLLDVGREQKEFIIKSASIARLEPCNGLETCKGLSCFFGCHGSSYKTAVYIRCAPQRGRLYFKWMSQHLTQRQSLALCCREVIATEVSKASVSAAKYNLAANGMTNVHIARLSSEEFAQSLARGARVCPPQGPASSQGPQVPDDSGEAARGSKTHGPILSSNKLTALPQQRSGLESAAVQTRWHSCFRAQSRS